MTVATLPMVDQLLEVIIFKAFKKDLLLYMLSDTFKRILIMAMGPGDAVTIGRLDVQWENMPVFSYVH